MVVCDLNCCAIKLLIIISSQYCISQPLIVHRSKVTRMGRKCHPFTCSLVFHQSLSIVASENRLQRNDSVAFYRLSSFRVDLFFADRNVFTLFTFTLCESTSANRNSLTSKLRCPFLHYKINIPQEIKLSRVRYASHLFLFIQSSSF